MHSGQVGGLEHLPGTLWPNQCSGFMHSIMDDRCTVDRRHTCA